MVPDLAIVCDMSVVHQQHVIADARDHPPALSTTMDRSKFPDPIVVTDFQPRGLATVLQVLRIGTDRSELENPIASADRGFTLDHGVRTYHGVGPDPDLRPNYRARADPNRRIEFCSAVNHGRGVDQADDCCSSTSIAESSASAASSPSTRASARIFHSG